MPSSHALTLRPARADDAAAMAAMSRDWIETGLPWRYTPARVAHLIADAETCALVACDGAGLHGFAVMQFGETEAHLVLLCVRPAQRRRGIASSLLQWLTASARVAGMAAITLEQRADNPGARTFYRTHGYDEAGLVAGYYDGRVPALRMRQSLREGTSD